MPVKIDKALCIECGACIGVCPVNALAFDDEGKVVCKEDECIDCDACIGSCPLSAISN